MPALSGFKASPKTFVAANRGGSTGGTNGMTISYTNAAPRHGIKSKRRCVKPGRGKHGKSCTRYVSVGSFTHVDLAGFNTLVFTGRVRHRKLNRGSYRLQAISSANGKKSRPISLSFRVAS